jgi:hypothetical protein
MCMPHLLLTTRMDPGVHKSLVQIKAVHTELSLRLSFQLSHCHGGYMVGTTAGFRVMTMEALALWPHHRILQRYP